VLYNDYTKKIGGVLMRQATGYVIRALEESGCMSKMEYENKLWISQNADKLNIFVHVEDGPAMIKDIKEWAKKEGTLLIQKGTEVELEDFDEKQEALLLIKGNDNNYFGSRYSPKNKK
jgi:hypothetical protein